MISFLIKIFKTIILRLVSTGALSFLNPYLLKLDKWCEDKLGIDLIKQEKKFYDKYPGIMNRIIILEKNSHPCKELHEFDVYPALIKRIEDLEKKNGIQ
tara:strand:- start:40760 stop:41056 length:297 start_codon:yes stop_codon:yes gene_type:complete